MAVLCFRFLFGDRFFEEFWVGGSAGGFGGYLVGCL